MMRKLKLNELGRLSSDEFKSTKKFPFIVVLDNIRSAHNVGSAFRTCDGFAAEKLILAGISACPPNRDLKKTAIGAEDSVEWEYYEKASEALKSLKEEGYRIIGIEQTDKSIDLQHFSHSSSQKKTAFVFGNEVFGLSEDSIEFLDASVEIPMFGTKHSFNISVSLGIVLWEFVKNRI